MIEITKIHKSFNSKQVLAGMGKAVINSVVILGLDIQVMINYGGNRRSLKVD